MVVGAEDVETWEINNVGGPNWMDGVEKTGRTRVERLQTLRADFENQGITVRFDKVAGVGHQGVGVVPAVEEFAADVLRPYGRVGGSTGRQRRGRDGAGSSGAVP
jgi:hypothetical protein